MEGILYPNKAK